MRTLWGLALSIAVAAGGCREAKRGWPKATPPADAAVAVDPKVLAWRSDLVFLGQELPRLHKHLFFQLPEAEFRARLAGLRERLPTLSEDVFVVELLRLIADLGDGHTSLRPPLRPIYPLQVAWFEEGLFVTAAFDRDAWAVGQRITAIGGRPVDEVLPRLLALVPRDNASRGRALINLAFVQSVVAVGLGLANPDRSLTVTVATADGERPLVLAQGLAQPQPPRRDPAAAPLAERNPGQLYWFAYLPDARLLFFQYNRCANGQPTFAERLAEAQAVAAAQPVDRLVIDLRNNSGGNSDIARPLVDWLTADPALARRTFVLIGRTTFSSAVLNALALEDAGATLVGEVAGGAPTHYGETQSFQLPATGTRVVYSTKYHPHPRHLGRELVPTIAVPWRAADHFAGKDAALEAALAAPVPTNR